ncbi:MAG: DNA-binding protein [Deltaproteobacteria bacterium]|nr:DNA-binding protein [Deltaproteobacteria bacterium]MBW2661196.1 DNA-binding protein [Deltaproteobacteria bacterium]
MKELSCFEFQRGRIFAGRFSHGGDLINSIEEFCKKASIQMAVFSVIGAVSSYTIGVYDQKQQVYVTFTEKAALEIVSCTGNVSLKEGKPFIHAHILLTDEHGKTIGGHLFPETIIYAGEINLQELTGKPMERTYDNNTGLMLWN